MRRAFTLLKHKCALLLWVVAVTTLSSCSTSRSPIRENNYSDRIRVACVGDSITFGYGIPDRERQSYPAQLQNLLGARWEVRNFGVNGATALERGTRPYSLLPACSEALAYNPDVVIIKRGTNDTNNKSWPPAGQIDYVSCGDFGGYPVSGLSDQGACSCFPLCTFDPIV